MADTVDISGRPEDFHERLASLFRYGHVGMSVGSVAHDVNNYLGAMLAYAELVELDPNIGPNPKRMLRHIIDSVRKCSGVIATLTAVARKEKPDANAVAPGDFISQVIELKSYDFKVARVPLEFCADHNLPFVVVDRPKLIMAVLYLLYNALEAAPEAAEYRVKVAVAKTDTGIEIAVKDSGPVIAEETQARLFEPFFTTKGGIHLGLGLTLAREIALYHHGALTYDPARGFVLSLPADTGLRPQ